MKTLLLTLVTAIGLTAYAGNEGAQAVPDYGTKVVAEYIANSGFFGWSGPGPIGYSYQILSNRDAVVISYYRNHTQDQIKRLRTLSFAEFSDLSLWLKKIKPGNMYDPQPNNPGCQDAPSFRYVVHLASGEMEIGKQAACKTWKRHNASSADAKVIKMLQELEQLNRQQ